MTAELIEVTVARIDAKLDALTTLLASNRELLMETIKAGDRESQQGTKLIEQRVDQLEEWGKMRDRRLDNLEEGMTAAGKFEAKVYGIATGIGLVAGAGGFGIAKALGL